MGPGRRIAAVAMAVVASLAVAGAAGGASLPRAATVRWTVKDRVAEQAMEPAAVACPTAVWCVAGGASSLVNGASVEVTANGGASWARSDALPAGLRDVVSLSCPTTGWCEAVAASDHDSSYAILGSSDGGLRWTTQHVVAGQSVVLSCAGTSGCVAVAMDGTAIDVVRTQDGGAAWTTSSFSDSIVKYVTGVACSSSTTCEAIGYRSGTTPWVGGTTNDGLTWTNQSTAGFAPMGDLTALTCSSSTFCAAIDGEGVVATTDGGAAWTRSDPTALQEVNPYEPALACDAAGACDASLVGGAPGATIAQSTDDAASWQDLATPPSSAGVSAIACPATGGCLAVGLTFVPVEAQALSIAAGTETPIGSLDDGELVATLSCTSVAHCLAAGPSPSPTGSVPAVLRTETAGSTWAEGTLSASGWIQALACATATSCFAVVGESQPGSGGASAVDASSDGGATWHRSAGLGLAGYAQGLVAPQIACGTSSDCAVLVDSGTEITTDGGAHWTLAHPPHASKGGLSALSCAGTTCVLLGEAKTSHVVQGALWASSDGGVRWSYEGPQRWAVSGSVDCLTATRCVAVGTDTADQTSAAVSTDGGVAWRTLASLPGALGAKLSCESASSCLVALDDLSGSVSLLGTVDGASSWSRVPSPAGATPVAVACVPKGCWTIAATSSGGRELAEEG